MLETEDLQHRHAGVPEVRGVSRSCKPVLHFSPEQHVARSTSGMLSSWRHNDGVETDVVVIHSDRTCISGQLDITGLNTVPGMGMARGDSWTFNAVQP